MQYARLRRSFLALLAFTLMLPSFGSAKSSLALPPVLDPLSPPPLTGRLPSGMHYILQPMDGSQMVAAQLWYRTPATGFEAPATPSLAEFTAETIAASSVDGKVSLSHLVQRYGGTITITVTPDSTSVALLVPARYAAATLSALTHAYCRPQLTQDGYKKAATDLNTQYILDRFDGVATLKDALFGELFTQGPAHFPALRAADLPHIQFDQLVTYASRGFLASNALLVLTGAVTPGMLDSLEPLPPSTLDSEPHIDPSVGLRSGPDKQNSLFPGSGLAWVGPPITDDRAATAMDFLADYLFNDQNGTLTSSPSFAQGFALTGQFITYHNPGVFYVVVLGSHADAKMLAVEAEVHHLEQPLNLETFTQAREAFISHLERSVENPADFAASLGWYSIEGSPQYAPGYSGEAGVYFRDAVDLTPEFVASIARRYFSTRPVHVRSISTPPLKKATT